MPDAAGKARLRIEARARRTTLARNCRDFAARIATLGAALNLPEKSLIAGYWPIGDEADPRDLMAALAARGHPLSLPRIERPGAPLSFRRWRGGDVLLDNHHGIAEPLATAEIVTPLVLLIPLLAFDATGHRLGYGGGYYDRTLAALENVLAIGIAYAGQELPELPHQPHDHPLDMILTEQGVRRFDHQTPGSSR